MGSNMVSKNLKTIISHKKKVELVKNYVQYNLPFLILTDEYDDPSGYWGFKYMINKIISVEIECHRGFFVITINQNGKEINLYDNCFKLNFEPGDYKELIDCQLVALKEYFQDENKL